jgi:hypothetical protein
MVWDDMRSISSSNAAGSIRVWDAVTGNRIFNLKGQRNKVLSLSLTNVPGMSAAGSCALCFDCRINDLDKHVPPAMLELIAARCLSEQPEVLVVLADLRTGAISYAMDLLSWKVQKKVRRLHQVPLALLQPNLLSLRETRAAFTEMGALVANFIRTR